MVGFDVGWMYLLVLVVMKSTLTLSLTFSAGPDSLDRLSGEMLSHEMQCQKINEAWFKLQEAPTLFISYIQAMGHETEQQ